MFRQLRTLRWIPRPIMSVWRHASDTIPTEFVTLIATNYTVMMSRTAVQEFQAGGPQNGPFQELQAFRPLNYLISVLRGPSASFARPFLNEARIVRSVTLSEIYCKISVCCEPPNITKLFDDGLTTRPISSALCLDRCLALLQHFRRFAGIHGPDSAGLPLFPRQDPARCVSSLSRGAGGTLSRSA